MAAAEKSSVMKQDKEEVSAILLYQERQNRFLGDLCILVEQF
jgi:hypothetical protein